MMKFGILIATMLLALTSIADAQSKHLQDIGRIDAALPSAKISPTQRAQVVRLRNEGERFHSAGEHGKAEVVLEQAKAILKVR